MKKLYFILVFVLIWKNYINCQQVDTIYYSLFGKIGTQDKYSFYRVIRHDSASIRVYYYSKTGRILNSGGYKSIDLKEKTGPFNYYRNEKIHILRIYEPSKYPEILKSLKGILENIPQQSDSLSLRIHFYKKGNLQSVGYISECCYKNGKWIFLSKDTNYLTIESYRNGTIDGPFSDYYKGHIISTGYYKNGKKDGEWLYYYSDTHILFKTEIYLNGKKLKTLR